MRIRSFALCLIALTAACGDSASRGAAGADGGTLVISSGSDADGFLPPVTINAVSTEVEAQIFEKLAEVGLGTEHRRRCGLRTACSRPAGRGRPTPCRSRSTSTRRRAGTTAPPVTANDVRFTWQVYNDSATGSLVRPLIKSIDSVTVRDSLTAVFWFSQPHARAIPGRRMADADPPGARAWVRCRAPRSQERRRSCAIPSAAGRSSSRAGTRARRSSSTRTRTTIWAVRISTA